MKNEPTLKLIDSEDGNHRSFEINGEVIFYANTYELQDDWNPCTEIALNVARALGEPLEVI